MMKKITLYLVMSFLLVSVISFAQGTVTGTINDSDLGGPLSGAKLLKMALTTEPLQILMEIFLLP